MADALQGIGAVVSTQVLSRVVTFLLNVLIARLAAPSAYGLSYVSLQLFSNLSLFATKEGFRKAALRVPDGDRALALQSSLNLGWGGALVAVLVSLPLAGYWSYSEGAAPPSYAAAVAIMALASVVEAAGEPFLIVTLAALDFRSRALGEGAAIMVRTVAMFLLAALHGDIPLAFAVSQLLYSAVWVAWFSRRAAPPAGGWRPATLPGGELLHPSHRRLLVEFSGLVAVKLLLTEGEKLLLLALFTKDDWGVFGLVSNLGSIILRLLFAPTEEIAYSSFGGAGAAERRGQWGLLRGLLLLQGGIGWLGLCFGPGFSGLAVRVLYGPAWAASEAPRVLAAYCALLFAMALNGILEACMYALCSPAWVRTCNRCQLAISAVLVAISWLCRGAGPIALVWANCASMLLRVLLCAVFVRQHFAPSWEDLRLAPVAKLVGLLAMGGLLSSLAVPTMTATVGVPWARAAVAVALAAAAIAAAGVLCRHELRATLAEVRKKRE